MRQCSPFLLATLAFGLLGSCGKTVQDPPAAAIVTPSTSQPGRNTDGNSPAIVQGAHTTKEWKRITATLAEARSYYAVEATWGEPAKISEDRRMERALSSASKDIRRLVEAGALSEAEAALLDLDVEKAPCSGHFSSRTVLLESGGMMHRDYLPHIAGWSSWAFLRRAMPALEHLADSQRRNPVIVLTVIATAEKHVAVLKSEAAIQEAPNGIEPAEAVRDRAKRLLATIRHNLPGRD